MGRITRCSGTSSNGSVKLQQVVSKIPRLHIKESMAKMNKPRIRYWKHGLWECSGIGLNSFDKSPEAAYIRWTQFITRMRIE
jgi:hypothetical protein